MECEVLEGEFPLDVKVGGVVVVPVNLQGIVSLTHIGRRFKHKFPKTHKQYLADCISGSVYAGFCKIYFEDGYRIALMYYKNFEIGSYVKNENSDRQSLQFSQCLTQLFSKTASEKEIVYYSPPIPYNICQQRILSNGSNSKWCTLKE